LDGARSRRPSEGSSRRFDELRLHWAVLRDPGRAYFHYGILCPLGAHRRRRPAQPRPRTAADLSGASRSKSLGACLRSADLTARVPNRRHSIRTERKRDAAEPQADREILTRSGWTTKVPV